MFFVWYKKLNDYQKMLLISFSPGPSGLSIQRYIVWCVLLSLYAVLFLVIWVFVQTFTFLYFSKSSTPSSVKLCAVQLVNLISVLYPRFRFSFFSVVSRC